MQLEMLLISCRHAYLHPIKGMRNS